MIARIALLIAAILFGTLSILLVAIIMASIHQGYGLELSLMGVCIASGTAAVIRLGAWLFLRVRPRRNTI
jgi:hypothetical protein